MNQLILAPMVRTGYQPTRTFMLRHSADYVYTDVVMCKALLLSKKEEFGNYITFTKPNHTVLILDKSEAQHTVVQLASDDVGELNAAGNLIKQYCCRCDINLGCNKPFAKVANSGAILAQSDEKLKHIISNLDGGINWSAKTRLSEDVNQSVRHVRLLLQRCQHVAIHARYFKDDRDRDPIKTAEFFGVMQELTAEEREKIIYNGDIFTASDYNNFAQQCKKCEMRVFPVMIARGALRNVFVFDCLRGKRQEDLEDMQGLVEIGEITKSVSCTRKMDYKAVVMFGLKYIRNDTVNVAKDVREKMVAIIQAVAQMNDVKDIMNILTQSMKSDDM